MRFETFRNQQAGVRRLDELLADGQVVGMQTSVFWLPYMPEDLRFHFNAHNVLAFAKDAASGDYHLSDPVVETAVTCPADALQRARFAKGALAPKGLLYYTTGKPATPDWARVIPAAIKKTTRIMLDTPLPIIGVRGIRRLANAIGRLEKEQRSGAEQDVHRSGGAHAGRNRHWRWWFPLHLRLLPAGSC
jgi:hypothetical protein